MEAYAAEFAVEGVTFSMQDHLMMIDIDNAFASAQLTTHGACVLSFVPKQGVSAGCDVLWVSPSSVYDGSKPVRGGIPICWPWFGKATEDGLPAHGFVRNKVWHLHHVAQTPEGETELELRLASDEQTLALWPHAFQLVLKVVVGQHLSMSLTTLNVNDHDLELTEAFHTYFQVADSRALPVNGLEGSTCLDKLTFAPGVPQTEPLVVHPPIDSVFASQSGLVTIEDKGNARRILVSAQDSRSKVVWNPGPEIIKGFADMPNDAWPGMVCVEAGNVLDDAVMVPSEQVHHLTMTLSVESL